MDCFFSPAHRKFAGTLPGKWGQRWQAEDINTVIKVLVRSLGDTWVSVVISPQQQRWLIGRQPHGGHVEGKMGWERHFFFWFCVFWAVGGFCRATLWAVNTAERSGVFLQKHNGPFSHYCQFAKPLAKLEISTSISFRQSPVHTHTHTCTPSCQTPQPHNWIYACIILCPTWQLCS